MSLSDEKNALMAKLEALNRERTIAERQLAILEDATRRMAEAEHARGDVVAPQVTHPDGWKGHGRLKSKHPFVVKCTEMGLTVKAASNLLQVPLSTVRSWYTDGDEGRTIPDEMVDRLSKAPWNIPKSAWKRRK